MSKKSKAQLRAEAFQRLVVQYGFEVKVVMQEIPAEMFTHDPTRVALPARTIAHVHFYDREVGLFGDFGSAAWVSWDGTEERRPSTRFVNGHVYEYRKGNLRTRKFRTPRKLYAYINGFSYRLPTDEATRITEQFAEASGELA